MSDSNLPGLYSKGDVDNARTKGQLIGWVQGAAVAVGGMLLMGVIGWLPTLAIVSVVGYLLYRLLRRSR
jgi:hypothetical protein